MANAASIQSRCVVCDSPDHVHCSLGCERCDDPQNPHPKFAQLFCKACKKSLCYHCYSQHLLSECSDPLRQVRLEQLRLRLLAASLDRRQYLTLRNSVRVLRLSGALLNPEQQRKLQQAEAVCEAYREMLFGKTEAHG